MLRDTGITGTPVEAHRLPRAVEQKLMKAHMDDSARQQDMLDMVQHRLRPLLSHVNRSVSATQPITYSLLTAKAE